MTWYIVPAGDKTNKEGERNRRNTLDNKYDISPLISKLDTDVQVQLYDAGFSERVFMWGAKSGPRNAKIWSTMSRGDKVIFYAAGSYAYLGVVLVTTQNKEVADFVWPPSSENASFEYIYFLTDVQRIDINATDFNREFEFKGSPQAFNPVASEKMVRVSERHGSIENAIETLMGSGRLNIKSIVKAEAEEDAEFQADLEDVVIANPIVDNIPKTVKPKTERTSNSADRDKKVAKSALIIADYKCEYNHSHDTFISPKSQKPYMEAHHLVPYSAQNNFSFSIDITPNVISLCPNCHRAIHHGDYHLKKSMIMELFTTERKKNLLSCGIDVNVQDIINFYL